MSAYTETIKTMKRMDWRMLRMQKSWLLQQTHPVADGLVNLIDALQDAAVADGIATQREVFHG